MHDLIHCPVVLMLLEGLCAWFRRQLSSAGHPSGKQAESMLLGWCRARSHSFFREAFVSGSSCQLLVQMQFWAQQKLLHSSEAKHLPLAKQLQDLFSLRGRIARFQPGFCRNTYPLSEERKMKHFQTSSVALIILNLRSASPHYYLLDLQSCFSAPGLLGEKKKKKKKAHMHILRLKSSEREENICWFTINYFISWTVST